MKFTFLTIFPDIYTSFVWSSLIDKAVSDGLIDIQIINIRDYVTGSKNKQVDDEIYWGGAGMLIKAQPVIDALKHILHNRRDSLMACPDNAIYKIKIIFVWPSKTVFDQQLAHDCADIYDENIYISGRYEGIDHRVKLWCESLQIPTPKGTPSLYQGTQMQIDFAVISLWQFIVLWGELPSMVMCEATARLLPWVIKEQISREEESYAVVKWMNNLEYPQYTRPQEVEWYPVPEILLSGHHKKIQEWRDEQEWSLDW